MAISRDGARDPVVRVAIVGAGMIGRAHARAFRTLQSTLQPAQTAQAAQSAHPPRPTQSPPSGSLRVELTMIADADAALARDAQARWEIQRVADSWQAVADATDVDIACVALPNHEHREAVEALVAAGKHVLCEKPLASTMADSEAIVEAARRAGVINGTGFNLRRAPAVAAIKAAIDDGVIGQPRQFSARYMTDYAVSPEVPFTWRYERRLAGSGALGDIGSHVIDLARFLVGEVREVTGASLATSITERPVPAAHVTGHGKVETTGEFRSVDTDDFGAFTCVFENGAIGDVHFSRIATGFRNSPAFELVGSRGSVAFDMERAAEFQVYVSDTGGDEALNGFRRVVAGPRHPYFSDVVAFPVAGVGYGYAETYLAQAHAFVQAVVDGRAYEPSFLDGLAAVRICEDVLRKAEAAAATR